VVSFALEASQAIRISGERQLLIGGDGIALEEFLMKPVAHWVK
jgi:hypothetical protein